MLHWLGLCISSTEIFQFDAISLTRKGIITPVNKEEPIDFIGNILSQAGIDNRDIRIDSIKGFAARVILFSTSGGRYVIKEFLDTSLGGTKVYFAADRLRLETEIYKVIDQDLVPKLYLSDSKTNTLLLEQMYSFELLTDYLLSNESLPGEFLENILSFLVGKLRIMNIQYQPYTYLDAMNLKSFNVDKKHQPRIIELFREGTRAQQCINLAGLSPKNIFINSLGNFKLIDFEDTFVGDFIYDFAFIFAHLLIYGIIQNKNKLINQIINFIKIFKNKLNLTDKDYNRFLGYMGLLFLHRMDGFNIEGDFQSAMPNLKLLGEELLYGNKMNLFADITLK